MAGLAGHLEGNAIGSSVLELEGGGGQVVEVLVEELYGAKKSRSAAFVAEVSSRAPSRGAKQEPSKETRKKKNQLERSAYVVGRLGNVGEGGDRHFGGFGRKEFKMSCRRRQRGG